MMLSWIKPVFAFHFLILTSGMTDRKIFYPSIIEMIFYYVLSRKLQVLYHSQVQLTNVNTNFLHCKYVVHRI